jgi:DUF1365 family protein
MPRASALYRGALLHTRRDHLAHRTFRYPVFMASIDLDEVDVLDRDLRLFAHNGRALFALHDRDYENGAGGLREELSRLRAEHGLSTPTTTRLITNLRVAGYTFNPVSFFLDYDEGGALTNLIAEVNNTYGGRYRYLLGPAQRIGHERTRVGFRHDRELFVSPFLHGPRSYELWFPAHRDPEHLAITMHVDTPGGERIFTATMAGKRRTLTDRALLAAAIRYPLMSLQVIGLIHLEALKLRYLYGVPYRRPGPDHRPLDET